MKSEHVPPTIDTHEPKPSSHANAATHSSAPRASRASLMAGGLLFNFIVPIALLVGARFGDGVGHGRSTRTT